MSSDDLPSDVLQLLNEDSKSQGLHVLLSKILVAFRTIGTCLRNGDYSSDHAGTQNAFGDHQLDVDIKTDEGDDIHSHFTHVSCSSYQLFLSFDCIYMYSDYE